MIRRRLSKWLKSANARFEASILYKSFLSSTWFGYVLLLPNLQNLHRNTGSLTDGHRPTPRSPVHLRSSAKLAKRAVEAAPRRLLGSCRSHPNRDPSGFKAKETLKDSLMNESHVTTHHVPPGLCIWPRKGGARRPHLRPLSMHRSTFKTLRIPCLRCWKAFTNQESGRHHYKSA